MYSPLCVYSLQNTRHSTKRQFWGHGILPGDENLDIWRSFISLLALLGELLLGCWRFRWLCPTVRWARVATLRDHTSICHGLPSVEHL